MSKKNYNQNLMMGAAAVVAGILGTLSTLKHSNRTVKGWAEQARDAATHVLEGEMVNKNMVLGGIAGGLIGAATALLLAPKAGIDLIKDLAHPFSHQKQHKRSSSRRAASSSRKSSARSRSGARAAKKHATHRKTDHAGEGKSHKSNAKKKSPARRRTATALKKAAASEKIVKETTQAT